MFDNVFVLLGMIRRIKAFEATHIISRKLNEDHPLTYEEALTHEMNMHKKLKVSQFLSFVYCVWLFLMNFGFFGFHIFGIIGFIFWY